MKKLQAEVSLFDLRNEGKVDENKQENKDKKAMKFILEFGKALQTNGVPAHILEYQLEQLCSFLDINGSFLITPSYTVYSLTAKFSERKLTRLVRIRASRFNMDRITKLDHLAQTITSLGISLELGISEIKRINNSEYQNVMLVSFIASFFATFGIGFFFSTSIVELAFSLSIATIVWLLGLVQPIEIALPAISSFIGTILAYPFAYYVFPINISNTVLAGVILLVPGLTLTMGMVELATGHIISGICRLVSALTTQFQIAYAITLGLTFSSVFFPPLSPYEESEIKYKIGAEFFPMFAMIAGLAFALDLRVQVKQVPIAVVACFIGALCARYLKPALGETSGTLVSGVTIALVSNFSANLIPPHVSLLGLVPGILMLVPGALGVRGLATAINEISTGLEMLIRMFLIALQLAVAIILANVLIPVKGTSHNLTQHHHRYDESDQNQIKELFENLYDNSTFISHINRLSNFVYRRSSISRPSSPSSPSLAPSSSFTSPPPSAPPSSSLAKHSYRRDHLTPSDPNPPPPSTYSSFAESKSLQDMQHHLHPSAHRVRSYSLDTDVSDSEDDIIRREKKNSLEGDGNSSSDFI